MDLKKITKAMLAASALGVSSFATAASFAPPPLPVACVQDAVVLPCERSAWDLGIEAIYVRQASGTNWYVADRVAITGTSFDDAVVRGDAIQHDPRWAWGFRLEGSYHWGTGSDLTVNWTHFQKKTNNDYIGGNLFSNAIIGIVPWDAINDWADSRFDQVNVEFGQDVEYGKRVRVRSHAGVSFVRLDHERQLSGYLDAEIADVELELEAAFWQKSRYNGVGPRFGQDISYDIGSGFSVYGRYAVSVTAGTSKNESAFGLRANIEEDGWQKIAPDLLRTQSKRTIVAGLETRLGVKYTYPMAQGDLIIDAAYQVNSYQGILQQATPDLVSVPGYPSISDNNWGYHGASIGLKWIGNA